MSRLPHTEASATPCEDIPGGIRLVFTDWHGARHSVDIGAPTAAELLLSLAENQKRFMVTHRQLAEAFSSGKRVGFEMWDLIDPADPRKP